MDLRPDLAHILATAPGSVDVVCAGVTGKGILRLASKLTEVSEGRLEVSGMDRALVIDPLTFPGLVKGATLIAGGQTFKVQRPLLLRESGSAVAILEVVP